MIHRLTTEQDLRHYNDWVQSHPQGSLWQSLEWKRFQEALGREVRVYGSGKWTLRRQGYGGQEVESGKMKDESGKFEATALVVIDRTTGGFSTWEIPRGPLWNNETACVQLLEYITGEAKKDMCIVLYLSPTMPLIAHSSQLTASQRRIHAAATRIIDLTKSDEEILAQMHPKGRYNIALARRHDVEVRQGAADDADAFYELLRSTGDRNRFTIARQSHYRRFLTDLGHSFILMAYAQGKPIAGLIGVIWPPPSPLAPLPMGEGNVSHQRIGIYYYGASSYENRQLMAPYLLQWEAMKLCRQKGCTRYDLLGIAASDAPDDPWAGISDFKRKFGGTIVTYPPEQVLVLRPVVRAILEWKRRILG